MIMAGAIKGNFRNKANEYEKKNRRTTVILCACVFKLCARYSPCNSLK